MTDPAAIASTADACVALHNAGTIDLLDLIATGQLAALDGTDSFRAIDRIGELLPALKVSSERLLRLLDAHVPSVDHDGLSYRLLTANQAWCRRPAADARRIVETAAASDAAARRFLAPALEATQNIALARDTARATDAFTRDAAIAVLGNLDRLAASQCR